MTYRRESWANGLTLLVVDEVLLAHLARHEERSIQAVS